MDEINELRCRVLTLEKEIAATKAAHQEAETKLANSQHSNSKDGNHAHHASENMRAYGRTDGVIFIEPHRMEQVMNHLQSHQETGFCARLTRMYFGYGIDGIIARPKLHQWIHNGKLYREASERQASKFELFFDLLFVGIVHQIADAAAEQPTGLGLVKYVLTFCPAYAIWSDVRDIVNQFGTDDVSQRMFILWIMTLLVGYSNSASSIEIGGSEFEETDVLSVSTSISNESAVHWALGFAAVAKFSKVLLIMIYSFFLTHSRRALLVGAFNSALASLFFLIAIFLPLHGQIALVTLGIFLEHILKIVGIMIIKLIERAGRTPARNLRSGTNSIAGTLDDGVVEENFEEETEDSSDRGTREKERNKAQEQDGLDAWMAENKKCLQFPAINIEHHVDRLGAFVTIVLGEMIANIFFKNSIASGLSSEAGRSFLTLILAFNLNWLYFGSEACKHFIHALRRHWLTSAVFTYIHLPLIMALLLASAATNKLVVSTDVGTGLTFFFGTGVGISVTCIAIIGFAHKSLDHELPSTPKDGETQQLDITGTIPCARCGRLRWGRPFMLTARLLAGLALSLIPFAHSSRLDSTRLLAIYVGITAALVAQEVFLRIERRVI